MRMLPAFVLLVLASPLQADEPATTNRLIREKSPYLLQHAHNPVDWYPWGGEAFARARKEEKPVFLSIGYSTCHWCHVMARESFSDPAIARILNEHFISIKVDREERPDVDALYLAFLQATRGGGGWPANIFLLPDGTPFFGGTYYPREPRDGLPGFEDVLNRVAELWSSDRKRLEAAGAQTLALLDSVANPTVGEELPTAALADATFTGVARRFRPETSGFGPAPRFPEPSTHEFLLRYAARSGRSEAAQMSLDTLRAMSRGGLYDQLGGGFHRYTTDERWRVPHFEKMLYDQAQLASLYFDAWRVSGDADFLRVGRETLDFVLREMGTEGHGFASAVDAASSPKSGADPVEGAYYTWTLDELTSLFPDESQRRLALDAYSMGEKGNVPKGEDPSGDLEGRNVLRRERTVSELARQFDLDEAKAAASLNEIRDRLLKARASRPHPLVDDKILTGWNGLLISALADGFEVTNDSRYLEAATDAARFIEQRLWDSRKGGLWRRWRHGDRYVTAFAEDYAFLIRGLLDLYAASFDIRWIELARRLQVRQDELFWNEERGAYSMSGSRDDGVILELATSLDSTIPSHDSISVLNLLELAQVTGQDRWNARAKRILVAAGPRLAANPSSDPTMIVALDAALSKPKQIIVAGHPGRADTRSILEMIHRRYLPGSIVLLADGGEGQKQLAEWLPAMESIRMLGGKATAYVCENFVCRLPTNDLSVIAKQLD